MIDKNIWSALRFGPYLTISVWIEIKFGPDIHVFLHNECVTLFISCLYSASKGVTFAFFLFFFLNRVD